MPVSPSSPGVPALIAAGSGTAMASVCAVGLLHIAHGLGGLWAAAAVGAAGLLCAVLARVFARLSAVLPSGAGLIAFTARAFGRPAGVLAVAPYLLLMLFLVGFEALIVGELLAWLLPVPVAAGALGFLLLTWAVCRAGLRIGYRAQALATWALFACLVGLSAAALLAAGARGDLLARLHPVAPEPAVFAAAVGQALFLFMGFELTTSHVEIAGRDAVRRALHGSVAVLSLFYAVTALGFACLAAPPATASGFDLPQLAFARQASSPWLAVIIILTCLLASFTSFNGALLALSRFIYALAAQGMLPRPLARLEPRSLVARPALLLLLGLAAGFTVLVYAFALYQASIFAAAVAAAAVYAVAVLARERPPFRETPRARWFYWTSAALAAGLLGLALGVVVEAGAARNATLLLLAAAYGAAGLLWWRGRMVLKT